MFLGLNYFSLSSGVVEVVAEAWAIRNRVDDGKDESWRGGQRRRVLEAVSVQMLGLQRPQLSVSERGAPDPISRAGAMSHRC